MEDDTESDSDSMPGQTLEEEHAAEALCLLASSGSKERGLKLLAREDCNTRREARNNLERVRLFELRTRLAPPKRRRRGLGDSRGSRGSGGSRSSRDSDVGRRVQVLWIPHGFPKFKRALESDLRAYNGRVVQHEPGRGAKTHRVLYTDKTVSWHATDQLKFLD
jgi:hypothetical protein